MTVQHVWIILSDFHLWCCRNNGSRATVPNLLDLEPGKQQSDKPHFPAVLYLLTVLASPSLLWSARSQQSLPLSILLLLLLFILVYFQSQLIHFFHTFFDLFISQKKKNGIACQFITPSAVRVHMINEMLLRLQEADTLVEMRTGCGVGQ